MELIRTFLAVPPDEALRKRLAVLFPAGLAGAPPVGARPARDGKGGGIRWAELSGLHVTLVFLGATRPEQVPTISR